MNEVEMQYLGALSILSIMKRATAGLNSAWGGIEDRFSRGYLWETFTRTPWEGVQGIWN